MKKEYAIKALEDAFGVKMGGSYRGTTGALSAAIYRAKDGEEPANLEVKEVREIGGYEGAGEDYELVVEITVKDSGVKFLVQVQGDYNSYEGVEFYRENLKIVEAYEKTVTDYREVAE